MPICALRSCRKPFERTLNTLQSTCSWQCALALVVAKRERDEAKLAKSERKADKVRREKLKTVGQLEADCREIVQHIARIRDRHDGCISCHMPANYGGAWHGSHYRAHGGCSSLQMHLWNIHKACAQCNLFKSGNREGFVRGLLAKPGCGRERLDWLDSQPKSRKFARDYLHRFKLVMGKRLRRLLRKLKEDRT